LIVIILSGNTDMNCNENINIINELLIINYFFE
jgi:hypothetical protein